MPYFVRFMAEQASPWRGRVLYPCFSPLLCTGGSTQYVPERGLSKYGTYIATVDYCVDFFREAILTRLSLQEAFSQDWPTDTYL